MIFLTEFVNILIVDDDANIRNVLDIALKISGFTSRQASDAYEANELIEQQMPDAILVDWMMPHLSGVEWIRQKRRNPKTQALPIIMITAKAQEANIISGLNAGADDYIIKPFSPRELVARIQSLIRRSETNSNISNEKKPITNLASEQFSFDDVLNAVSLYGNRIKLGPSEYKLLKVLVNNANRPLTRQQLANNINDEPTSIDERSLDVYVKRLRKTLKQYELDGHIVTIRGHGYQFSTMQ